MVLLIGPLLAQLTLDPRMLERFSPATQARLRASRVMTKDLENLLLRDLMETARQPLTRNPS